LCCSSGRPLSEIYEAAKLRLTEFMVVGALKEGPLRTHDEGEFVTAVGLDRAKVLGQLNGLTPVQIARQLAVKKTPMQQLQVMSNMFTHLSGVPPGAGKI
jgi:hypothetical protein